MTEIMPIMQPGGHGQNTGHGHVYPRPDGSRARCGGPRLCAVCRADADRKRETDAAALVVTVHHALVAAGVIGGSTCVGRGSVCASVAAAISEAGWHR